MDFNFDITHNIVKDIKGFVNNQLDLSNAVKNKNYHMKLIINDLDKNIEYETQVFLLIATHLDEDSSKHLINKGLVFLGEYNQKWKITSVHFLIREKVITKNNTDFKSI